MKSLLGSTSNVQGQPASEWPTTEEIDGFTWQLGPDPEDAREASELLNGDDYHTDEPTPDEVLDRQADEATALDQLERALPMF